MRRALVLRVALTGCDVRDQPEAGNGVVSSISYFDTAEHADESTRLASNWVREQKLETVLNAPKITSGEVVVHKVSELVQA